jgi:hypothetical protein
LQAAQLDLVRRVVVQVRRRRAGARAEDERERGVVADLVTMAISLSKSASVSPGKPTMKSDDIDMSGRIARSLRMMLLYSSTL